jgi:ankyrin repeat protein
MSFDSLLRYIRNSYAGTSQSEVAWVFSPALEAYLSAPGHSIDDAYGIPHRRTLLMEAALLGKKVIVKVLLNKGAKPDMNAFLFGMNRLAILECLLEASDKHHTPDQRQNFLNELLLHILTFYPCNENKPTIEWLLKKGADPNCTNAFNQTPLVLAVYGCAFKLVDLLLTKQANVNTQDNCGMTPLMYAVSNEEKRLDIVHLLLDAKASVNIENTTHQTALSIAIAVGWRKAADLLIQEGALFKQVSKKFKINTQKQLLDSAVKASRMILSSCILYFDRNLVYSHNRSMIAYAQGVGKQIAVNTPLPADVAHVINGYLFREGPLRINFSMGWHQNAIIFSRPLTLETTPKHQARPPKRNCRR